MKFDYCRTCGKLSGKRNNHSGPHLTTSSNAYEMVTLPDGTFKKRLRVPASGAKRQQWQYYCIHGRQKRTCVLGCNKGPELARGGEPLTSTEPTTSTMGETTSGTSWSTSPQGIGKKQARRSYSDKNALLFRTKKKNPHKRPVLTVR